MPKAIHPIAGAIAFITIVGFWLSTAISELFMGAQVVTTVKIMIPWGFFILLPALMAVGGSGFRLAKKMRGPLVTAKKKRMPFIAANGILILIPSALYLSYKAQAGALDAAFYAVQAVELIAGAVNIALLGLNMRDGLRLTCLCWDR
ncbi:hypothetical protein [Roseovarius sp. Pro17]|uniref:hypothetical protein n=1 Tax=Roseovarius sp. Pro17 TaxID=3108175 RepID=UPI002D7708B0|nr:hypothetical protein [Roseovarius sp. Pro17]